ncbi:Hypothetical Protein FCC1311_047112 [Hondaea fermentalgiana]|uniref:DIX domain-containing protein n=1 Tax=Hondaea fermentalgiana TaxID=2315210 RepID=A0A2R5GFE7_9STRA|nr:Hypothetical Protein FCC1311_047112 [Hondaea fermentalgiana]|eukprot:GBG28488.1 Hypothetical Protein FCC1311_047112 [Hondaea fermentalgiana]
MSSTSVYYFVPEDGDDEAHPNFFSLSKPAAKVRAADVRAAFPLPGAYHLRFKKAFKNTYVWLDVVDDGQIVPRFEGQIFAKISRLSAQHGAAGAAGQMGSGGSPVTDALAANDADWIDTHAHEWCAVIVTGAQASVTEWRDQK